MKNFKIKKNKISVKKYSTIYFDKLQNIPKGTLEIKIDEKDTYVTFKVESKGIFNKIKVLGTSIFITPNDKLTQEHRDELSDQTTVLFNPKKKLSVLTEISEDKHKLHISDTSLMEEALKLSSEGEYADIIFSLK